MHLFRTLKGVDTAIVLSALAEKSQGQIAAAALCVLCAFFTLTFYDLFALRTIGKAQVPYRIAALSSFTSYTIGHNIGATVFTGGAIRFRIYSDWGLSAIDVAKICFISGLTFWLGNTFVLGIGMIWHPQAAASIDCCREHQPAHRRRPAGGHRRLSRLDRHRPRPPPARQGRLEGGAAFGAAHAGADPDRRGRSRFLRAGDVPARALQPRPRFRHPVGVFIWRRCSALRATPPAASACSTPPCWSACRCSARSNCSPPCWSSASSTS